MDYKTKYFKYKKKYLKSKEIKDFKPVSFDDLPTTHKYNEDTKNNNIHIGQRKLLMNEIYFLTKYGDLSDTVVYAGAAHGIHIPILTELFPHKFLLYDPGKFLISDTDKIKIFNDYFTDDTAKIYSGKGVLFISDIRATLPKGLSKDSPTSNNNEFEDAVKENNAWQINWVKIMKPKMAMLKFRIPFNTLEPYEYFDGEIDLQPWAPPHSSETRLLTNGQKMKMYILEEYDAKMYYYNNFIRTKNNYDINFEKYIWRQYFKKVGTAESDIENKINKYMDKVSKVLKRNLKGKHFKS
jgi:cap2 methyltransferase